MRLGPLFAAAILAAGSSLIAPRPAAAQDLPQTRVRVVGYFSNLLQVREVERPFWTERIPQASGGRITAEYANQDTVGVRDFQILRVLQQGVTDFAASDISKMAGDDPVFEGCDLAGMVDDIQTARRACEAWRPVMAEAMERKFNARLMALFPNPSIVYWCNTPIAGLEDLRGKRVRVFNITQGDFVRAVGAAAVTIPFPEVVPAMQRRVVDCGLTGTLSGYALAVASAFAFALALIDRAHVRIDTLYTLLPVRVAAAFDLLAMAAMVSLASFLAMQGWRVFALSWSLGARALTQLNTPLSVPQALWFAGLAWFALVSILLMLRALVLLVQGDAQGVRQLLGTKTAAEELADERTAQQAIRGAGGAA